MITITPTSYEIHDDKELVATVIMFDEGGSTIEIKHVHDAVSWPEIAAAVHTALTAMHPEVKP